jgi:UPF0716 protein FxsA
MVRLLPLLALLPIADLLLLLYLGERFGAGPVLAWVIVAGLAGLYLAKREGLRMLRSFRRAAAERRLPEEGVLSGVLALAGAVLLVLPGVVTDAIGLLLLAPPTRRGAVRFVRRRIERRLVVVGGGRRARDAVIEVDRKR